MDHYLNRQQAGQVLASSLSEYANRKNAIVLALPRGGVPVAFEVAKSLHLPLDVFIVRKIGVPDHEELAMGAIASGGVHVFNQNIIDDLSIPQQRIQQVIVKESQELARREKAYRGEQPFPSLKNKTVILVDDGIATGATIKAAILAIGKFHPAAMVVAVPVVDRVMCEEISLLVDHLVCPLIPLNFYAVGACYEDFPQTEDDEVMGLLEKAKKVI